MPGMRTLATLRCKACGHNYYLDLPSGHGLPYPTLYDVTANAIVDTNGGHWFAQKLVEGLENRATESFAVIRHQYTEMVEEPILLNCLDPVYGHALLKLLNVQYYLDEYPDRDVVVFVPKHLEWLVPSGTAEVWVVNEGLSELNKWNDEFASEVNDWAKKFQSVNLGVAYPHPHETEYSIERFTGVSPFSPEAWTKVPATVTFAWREDRYWTPSMRSSGLLARAAGTVLGGLKRSGLPAKEYVQHRHILKLFDALRAEIDELRVAVTGVGNGFEFPEWITDYRDPQPGKKAEKEMCRQYSRSQIVVGVHGSNMLLPSAHAGAVIELVPRDRWGNVTQDLILNQESERPETVFDNRLFPVEVSPKTLAESVKSMLRDRPRMSLYASKEWNRHDSDRSWDDWRDEWRHRANDPGVR